MKKTNKKGFTIVELVIVIAVIAILSAVLIPTFTNVTKNAKKSAALQEATSALTVVLTEEQGMLDSTKTYYFEVKNNTETYWFTVANGKLTALENAPTVTDNDKVYTKTSVVIDDNNDEDATNDIKTTALEDLSTNVTVYKVAND